MMMVMIAVLFSNIIPTISLGW